MNVVMDEAAEVYVKETKPRRELGEWQLGHRPYGVANGELQVAYY